MVAKVRTSTQIEHEVMTVREGYHHEINIGRGDRALYGESSDGAIACAQRYQELHPDVAHIVRKRTVITTIIDEVVYEVPTKG